MRSSKSSQAERPHTFVPPPSNASPEIEVTEGARISYEASRIKRNPIVTLECLKRDRYTCRYCGFRLDLLKKRPSGMGRVLHAHHVRPLSDAGETVTKPSDLLTLCPTCHAVAHAIASAIGANHVDLKLLKKYYRV